MHTQLRQRLSRQSASPDLAAPDASAPRPAARTLTALDIFRFQWFEKQKAMNRRINPTQCWAQIFSEWGSLSDDQRASYEQEASIGIAQHDRRNGNMIEPPAASPAVDIVPAAHVPPVAAPGPDRSPQTMLCCDLGQSLAASTAGEALAITSGDGPTSTAKSFPMSAHAFRQGLVQGISGSPSVGATAAAFDLLHSKAATGSDFTGDVQYPRKSFGHWDRDHTRVAERRKTSIDKISEQLIKFVECMAGKQGVFSLDLLFAIEAGFKHTYVDNDVEVMVTIAHAASGVVQAGLLPARQQFIISFSFPIVINKSI